MTDLLDNHTLETIAQWHEKNARQCREIANDDPRTGADTRERAAIAATHHAASAVGIRKMMAPSDAKGEAPLQVVEIPQADTKREKELKLQLAAVQEHYQREAAPILKELTDICAMKSPKFILMRSDT